MILLRQRETVILVSVKMLVLPLLLRSLSVSARTPVEARRLGRSKETILCVLVMKWDRHQIFSQKVLVLDQKKLIVDLIMLRAMKVLVMEVLRLEQVVMVLLIHRLNGGIYP